MKLSFSGLFFKKGCDSKNYLNEIDIEMNNLSVISEINKDRLKENIDSVSVDEITSEEGIKKAKQIFKNNGIVIVKNFMSFERARECASLAQQLISSYQDKLHDKDWYEDEDVIIRAAKGKRKKLKNYHDNVKPLINVRQGQDEGMVDVFKIDQLIKSFSDIKQILSSSRIISIFDDDNAFNPSTLNCYLNKSVCNTRGFHVDSYGKRVKAFLYLSDVLELTDGPYVYVKGSNIAGSYRYINRALSKYFSSETDTPIVSLKDVVPVLSSAGALVISDQSGMHRGFPQAIGATRTLAVMNYR